MELWNNIKSKISWIITGLVAILGFLFLRERNKNNTLEAIDANRDVIDQAKELELKKQQNDDLMKRQEEYRKQLEESLRKELEREPTDQEVTDFFNKRYPN